VEPARRAANDGQHDSAIRRIAAGLILSEDPTFSLDRETPEPHKNALWKIAATSAPHATKRVVRWELRGLPYLISISGATSIALSPCGRFLAGSALCGGHPRIWSTETWEVVAVLEHDYAPGNVFWLKAPNLILTFGGNHQTALWRGDDFSFVRTVGEFRAGDICVSEGSRILFQSSSGATVCWDLIAGAKVSEFPGDYGVIKAIALSADGEVAASPGIDRIVRIWRTRDGAELRRIEPVSKMIDNEAVFLPGGKRVLVRSLGGVVRNCSVDPSSDPPDQQWEQKGLDVFPSIRGSDTCIAGDESGLVTLRDALTGSVRETVLQHEAGLNGAIEDPERGVFYTCSRDGSIRVTSRPHSGLERDKLVGTRPLLVQYDTCFVVLAVAPDASRVFLYDLEARSERWARTLEINSRPEVSLSPDGTIVAITVGSNKICVLSFTTGELVTQHQFSASVRSFAFTADGTHLVVGDSDEYTFAYHLSDWSRGQIFRPAGDYEIADALCFSADGSVAFVGLRDKRLIAHDAVTGAEIHDFGDHGAPVSMIRVDALNRFVIAGSSNGMATIWSIDSKEKISTVNLGVLSELAAVQFFPDGRKVLVVPGPPAPFASARVFDVATGAVLHRLPARYKTTVGGAVSADSRRVLIASEEGEFIEHDVSFLEAFSGDQTVYLAAALSNGVGIRSDAEKADILMQSAPDDLLHSLLEQLKRTTVGEFDATAAEEREATIDDRVGRAAAALRSEPYVPHASRGPAAFANAEPLVQPGPETPFVAPPEVVLHLPKRPNSRG